MADDDWLRQLTESLGDPALSREETGAILRLARDVAHGVERTLAPLSAFAVGIYLGRRTSEGASRKEALREALAVASTLIPGRAPEQDHI
jgi:hypothetical protein